MNCHFVVGQRVVLFDDAPRDTGVSREIGMAAGVKYPIKGIIYTVRSVYETKSGIVGLKLAEINNHLACHALGLDNEYGFEADRFRPVAERKTDISIFKAMLNPTRSAVPA